MKKEIMQWGLVLVIVTVLLIILGAINEKGIKSCIEAGHTEQYCKEGLK